MYFGAHTGKVQEYAIEIAADFDIELADGSEDAAPFELIEQLARPAKEEEDKDNVSNTV